MKILFVSYTRVGDAVLSTGVLSALVARYPDAAITVACGPVAAPLFTAAPGVVRVIPMAKRPWAGHWRELWRVCVRTRWDLVVDLRDSAISYLVRAGARKVLRGKGANVHRIVRLGALLGLDPPPAPRLWITEDAVRRASALLPTARVVLALGPTANWRGKQWPADRFADLAQRLTAKDGLLPGARVAVFGAPGEGQAAAPVFNGGRGDEVIDLVGKTDLLTAYAVLRRCAMFIGNDSGLMHLAAAAGIPTLGLFGPSREQNYAPWGPRAAFVRTPESYDTLVGGEGYDHRTTDTLMGGLTVDMVSAAARGLWLRCDSEDVEVETGE